MNMGLVGGFSGVAGGYGGQFASKLGLGLTINGTGINSPFLKGLVGGGLGGIGGGFAAGFTGTLLIGGDFGAAINAGISGARTGLTVGAPIGAVSASIQAQRSGLSPWTGKPRSSIQSQSPQQPKVSVELETHGPGSADLQTLSKAAEFLDQLAAGRKDLVMAELHKMSLTMDGQIQLLKIHDLTNRLVNFAHDGPSHAALSDLLSRTKVFIRIHPR